MSTNYTNYHELKEQDKDSVQTKIKYQTPKQPPLYNPNPRQSVPFIRVYLREPFDTGSGAQGWQSLFATETEGLSPTGNSVASAEQTSAAHETNPTRLYTVSSRASVLDPGSNAQRGGKVRLPQRPEVSSKQATQLPLPNGLRQPPEQIPPDHKASSSQPVSRDPVFLFNTSHFRPVWPLFGRINLRKTYPASLAAFWPDYFVVR